MFRSRSYRVDDELIVLVLTLLLVLGVIILLSTVTFCLSGVFILGMFVISAVMIHSHHQSLVRQALPVDPIRSPELAEVAEECSLKLQPGDVDVFMVNQNQMNAYTFGISSPKVLVLYTPLIRVMTDGELKFIVGHEMGHVALGHTWLNTIVGGVAGIPAPFGAAILLYTAFRWWNRICEFSADRAGLLACGDLNFAISALVKLVAPEIRSQREFEQAFVLIDAQDDVASSRFSEVFQTHPMLIRRINKLREYAQTDQFQRLRAGMNRNIEISRNPTGVRDEHQAAAKPVLPPAINEEIPPEERWPWLKK